jgi:hypothetical protein
MTPYDHWTAEERLIAEQAVTNFRELNRACDAALDGQVLAVAEQLALEQGRQLIRHTLESSLRHQAQAVEKKGRPADAAPAAEPGPTWDEKPER